MCEDKLPRVNMVQSICARPRMYTFNGTLQEVYDLLSGNAGNPIGGTLDRPSVALTLDWIQSNTDGAEDVVASLIERHGTEEAVLNAMADFAASLDVE